MMKSLIIGILTVCLFAIATIGYAIHDNKVSDLQKQLNDSQNKSTQLEDRIWSLQASNNLANQEVERLRQERDNLASKPTAVYTSPTHCSSMAYGIDNNYTSTSCY